MIDTGARGEERAARFLLRRGWRILARNWRGGGGEIDIVARRLGTVAFVEVKTRVDPAALEEPLVAAQRRRLIRAAESWLARHPEHAAADARFDVITVRGGRGARAVRHLPGAFYIPDAAVDASSTSKRRSSGYATDRNDVR